MYLFCELPVPQVSQFPRHPSRAKVRIHWLMSAMLSRFGMKFAVRSLAAVTIAKKWVKSLAVVPVGRPCQL